EAVVDGVEDVHDGPLAVLGSFDDDVVEASDVAAACDRVSRILVLESLHRQLLVGRLLRDLSPFDDNKCSELAGRSSAICSKSAAHAWGLSNDAHPLQAARQI